MSRNLGPLLRVAVFWVACMVVLEVLQPVWLPQRPSATLANVFGAAPALPPAANFPKGAPQQEPPSAAPLPAALPPVPAPIAASGGRAEILPGGWLCAGYHDGAMDLCGEEGDPVYAAADGTITAIGEYWDELRYGAYVIITTDSGLEIYTGHLDHETVNPLGLAVGGRITAGQPIGFLSEFPYSRPHTHIQLTRAGALVGPGEWWAVWDAR